MKLCLDIQALQGDSANRGVGRYSQGLAEAIIRSGRAETSLVLNTALSDGYEKALAWARTHVDDAHIYRFAGPVGIMGLIPDDGRKWQGASALYDAFLQHNGITCLHTSAPFDGMGDNTVIGDPRTSMGGKIFRLGTLYDLIPFEEPDLYLSDPRYRHWFNSRLDILKSYDLLLAISDYTRKIAIEFGGVHPDRIVAISTDTTGHFQPTQLNAAARQKLLKKYTISKSFIMHTGILEARKNVKLLLAAFAALPPELITAYQLVLVTKVTDAQKADMMRTAAQLGLPIDSLVFPGFVPDEDLAKLYSLTDVLVMPSLSEGFGLPLLEAMRCGAPVLGANATSIPEVVGSQDYLFDPHNPKALAEKLYRLAKDEGFAAKARKHSLRQQTKFSWTHSANLTLEALRTRYREISAGNSDAKVRYYIQAQTKDPKSAYVAGLYESDAILEKRNALKIAQSLPIVITGDASLSSEQENTLLSRPFGLIFADAESELTCSPEIKYAVDGYHAMLPAREDRLYEVRSENLSRLPQNFFSAATGTNISKAVQAGDKHCKDLFDFVSAVPSGLNHETAAQLSELAQTNLLPVSSGKTLYIDISELVHRDARTGIQRVVRSVLYHFLTKPHDYRVEAIYRDGDHYRLARQFCVKFLDLPTLNLTDSYVTFRPGDTFLGLDLDALISPAAMSRLRRERLRGLHVAWVVYDILPVSNPEWFDKPLANAVSTWVDRICLEADQLICISKAVADSLIEHLNTTQPDRYSPLSVSWWHLGSDLDGSAPSRGTTSAEEAMIVSLPTNMPVFLTVGTIEPRKGISKLLDAAEAFWASGKNAAFIIVGKAGWNVDPLLKRLRSHPELNKRIFWFEGISDELLNTLYTRATAALLPSEGEGFGLPLVEAAFHKKPIIARDLPIFREIANEGAYYFNGETAQTFAYDLEAWINLYNSQTHPQPNFPLKTWQMSSDDLYKVVSLKREYKSWKLKKQI